jgi:hypothetical protein
MPRDWIHTRLLAEAEAAGELDWDVSVGSTINRAHQYATNLRRRTSDAGGTGGSIELQESPRLASPPRE